MDFFDVGLKNEILLFSIMEFDLEMDLTLDLHTFITAKLYEVMMQGVPENMRHTDCFT